ncbi:MAG: hypothetical protein VW985_06185 [Gammaproteobacteria bacterium]
MFVNLRVLVEDASELLRQSSAGADGVDANVFLSVFQSGGFSQANDRNFDADRPSETSGYPIRPATEPVLTAR